jgi:hypothetical protein
MISTVSARDTFEALRPFVMPVFNSDDRGRLQVNGSGVILRVSEERFLLTAAHVLDGAPLYLPVGRFPRELPLEVDTVQTVSPEGDRRLDELDVGIVRLQSDLAKGLAESGYQSIVPANLALTEVDRPSARALYGFMGYPSSQNSRNPERKTLRRKCYSYDSEPFPPGKVQEKGFRPEVHIVVPVKKRKGMPKLEGMSGGAVWSLRGHLRQGPRLAAIGIEDRNRQAVLVGVRIKFFVAALTERFPELAFALPSINDVNVTP